MDVMECIRERRSIRKFINRVVSNEKITQILDSGRWAPSAGNIQNWLFIIVRDKGRKLQLSEASFQQYWIMNADTIIVVCSDEERIRPYYGERGELYSIQGCAAAIENMLLTAHALGLGACWVGAFDENMVKRILKIGDGLSVQALIPIGYSGEEPPAPKRLELINSVFLEEYGSKGVKPEKEIRLTV